MRKIHAILIVLLMGSFAHAQVFLNGVTLRSTNGQILYVNADSLLLDNDATLIQEGFLQVDKDVINIDGTVSNEGVIDINNNLINDDEISATNATSEIILEGDWENNGVYNANGSTVTLNGNVQNVSGTTVTEFFNLICLGGLNARKQLSATDARVLGILDLGDVEFATDVNTLSVLNTALNAIARNNGFVSSLGDGRLNRSTNSVDSYLFPVGANQSGAKYRPIVLTTQSNALEEYGVRFANTNASLEGFDVDALADSLCEVNPAFYHRIYSNQQVDIQMFYSLSEDGIWTDMAHWQDEPLWHDMGNENQTLVNGFQSLTIQDWNNFTTPAFALAVQNPFLDMGPTIEGFPNTDVAFDPLFLGPPINSISWTPSEDLDCDDCLNPIANVLESTTFTLTINEGDRCEVTDSILLLIIPNEISMPTGFTPNGDGMNDVFKPMNTNVEFMEMQVYNRWGEKIFETNDYKDGWDGTYKGVLQPMGVFAYFIEYRLDGQTQTKTQKGSITLLR